jgi:hypothetical protein
MRRSLTQDLILGKQQNPDGKKTVLAERASASHIINENDELTHGPLSRVNLGFVGPTGMDLELDSELDKFDIENRHNQQVVPTVAKDIFKYLKGNEVLSIHFLVTWGQKWDFFGHGVGLWGGRSGFVPPAIFFY